MNDSVRAEAIFNLMKRLRKLCALNPEWNFAVNLNGMNGAVDSKLFKSNQVVWCILDPESDLLEMLQGAVDYMEANADVLDDPDPLDLDPAVFALLDEQAKQTGRVVNWKNFSYCSRTPCNAAPMMPCVSLDGKGTVVQRAHYGRPQFGTARYPENNDTSSRH